MDPELIDDTSAARTAKSSYCCSELCTCIFTLPWFIAGYLLTKPECPVPLSLAYFFLMIVLAAGTVIGIGFVCAACPMMTFLFILARLFAIIGLECWLLALVTNTASNEKLCGAFPYIYGWIIAIICIIALLSIAIAIICCSICTCCAATDSQLSHEDPDRRPRHPKTVHQKTPPEDSSSDSSSDRQLPQAGDQDSSSDKQLPDEDPAKVGRMLDEEPVQLGDKVSARVGPAPMPLPTLLTMGNETQRSKADEPARIALQTQWAYKDRRQVPGANPNELVQLGDEVRAKQLAKQLPHEEPAKVGRMLDEEPVQLGDIILCM